MNALVIGGTRFMGKHLISALLRQGHAVTMATRGRAQDDFGDSVSRLVIDRFNRQNLKETFSSLSFDVVFDLLAYCSNDVRNLLDFLQCGKYVMVSSTAVYHKHWNTTEGEFNPISKELIWCDRAQFPYDEIKRQAECALFQKYSDVNFTAVRFPFVIGCDDYTKRLFFYVDHIVQQIPIRIDHYDKQMAFVRSDEAGNFLAFFADHDFPGAINGASDSTISIHDISDYIQSKTGRQAILSPDGAPAPYNGEVEYSINTDQATALGFSFSPLKTWIYDLIDFYLK